MMFGFRFWSQGSDEYRKALVAERRARIIELKRKMRSCATRNEKNAIRAEIRVTKAEFRRKFRDIRHSNFAAA